jgi:TRAP-type C4-dicarboxylate transport system permease small subunit
MNRWTRVVQILDALLKRVGYLCIIFSTLLVFVAVIMRYIFGFSIDWVEELSKVAVLAMVFLSSGTLALKDEHMKFTFVSKRFKGKSAEYMNLFSLSVGTAVCILLTIGSFHLVYDEAGTGVLTESGIFQLWWFHLFMLIGFTIFTLCYLYMLISFLFKTVLYNPE